MNILALFNGWTRMLALGAVLAATVAGISLAQPRRADAQAPVIVFKVPELHVASAEIKYLSGWFFTPGYYLVFTVKNTGTADAGSFKVDVRNQNNVTLESTLVASMAAGGGRMFWHKLPAPPNCGLNFINYSIVVDSGGNVFELNEANNTTKVQDGYGPGPC